ncbi:Apoptosis-inducing factor 3 [Nymphon striatum]|nr:Apoptosis-inducing factor 3 [Nymphon striatum]
MQFSVMSIQFQQCWPSPSSTTPRYQPLAAIPLYPYMYRPCMGRSSTHNEHICEIYSLCFCVSLDLPPLHVIADRGTQFEAEFFPKTFLTDVQDRLDQSSLDIHHPFSISLYLVWLRVDRLINSSFKSKMGTGRSSLNSSRSADQSDNGVTGKYSQKENNESDFDKNLIIADVCSESEMKDGEMREFKIGEDNSKVLMVRENGQYCALGTKCSHYGAPLVKDQFLSGTYSNGQIICPWHGACFNSKTGDIEDHPGLDSLPKYQVDIKDGRVVVTADKSLLKSNKRQRSVNKNLSGNDESDSEKKEQTVLIIGGGGAAATCVEELRYNGFSGKVIMATQESFLPYDRPKLSKALDSSGTKLALRSEEFYESLNIQILLNKKAVEVNTGSKTVKFCDDSQIDYDKLVLATGGTPRKCPSPGNDLNNIFYLRSPNDGNKIAETAKDKHLVVIGNSFIGMEVAAYFSTKAKSVSIVARSDTPFKLSLGPEIGARIKQWFETKETIKFYDGRTVDEFIGDDDGNVKSVKLDDGTVLPAEACIIGIGWPNALQKSRRDKYERKKVQWVMDSASENTTRKDLANFSSADMTNYFTNFLSRGKNVQANIESLSPPPGHNPDIFAAGDIVSFPLTTFNEERVNIGHWQLAQYQGMILLLLLQQWEWIPICSRFSAYLKSEKKLTKDEIRKDPEGWMPHTS